jgi:hypothetical protein
VCFREQHSFCELFCTIIAQRLIVAIDQQIFDRSRLCNAFFALMLERLSNGRNILNANCVNIARINPKFNNFAITEVIDNVGSDAGVSTQQQEAPTILDGVFANRANAQLFEIDSNDTLRHVPHTHRRVRPTAQSALSKTRGRNMSTYKPASLHLLWGIIHAYDADIVDYSDYPTLVHLRSHRSVTGSASTSNCPGFVQSSFKFSVVTRPLNPAASQRDIE